MKGKFNWLLTAALVSALAGCTVTQTRSGQFQVGFIELGTTTARFASANGATRIRKHVDGTWGLRFSDKLTAYNIGKFDDVRLVQTHSTPGKTAALLELRKGGCVDYELLTITNNNVDRHSIRPGGCNLGVEVGIEGDRMVMREATDGLAQFWIWSPSGVVRGRERPASRTVSTPPPVQAPRTAQRPQSTPSARPRAQASGRAPTPRPAPTGTRAVIMPTGPVQTDPIQPTRVVLVRSTQ